MHRQREEVRTWCKLLSLTDVVISPATDSMSTLCQCVGELCQCGRGVRRHGEVVCIQRSGSERTTFRKETC